jgi:hypothetical protein
MNENSLLPPHHKQGKRFTFQIFSSFHTHSYHIKAPSLLIGKIVLQPNTLS